MHVAEGPTVSEWASTRVSYKDTAMLRASTGTTAATVEGELGVAPIQSTEQSMRAKVRDWLVWMRMPVDVRASSSTVPYLTNGH